MYARKKVDGFQGKVMIFFLVKEKHTTIGLKDFYEAHPHPSHHPTL
jgi:hypothetical protein